MSRNGNKHLSHKESCKRYTTSGRCAINRQQRIKRAADGKKEPSRKQPETKLMMWARIIKNCPKGGTVVDSTEIKKRNLTPGDLADPNSTINLGWPKKYWKFGALNKFKANRVKNNRAKPKKGAVVNG